MLSINATFKCDQSTKKSFKNSGCLLTISVGQQTHEDDRLAATLKLINQSFHSCTIALNDSLQRYTMALGRKESPKELHDAANVLGDAWLERNEVFLSKLTIPLKVIRWDSWLEDTNFAEYDQVIREEMRDQNFFSKFEETALLYLDRYARRLEEPEAFDMDRAKHLCMEYLIEECAAVHQWPKTGCEFEMYTGKHNDAILETKKRFLMQGKPQSITIGFNKRADLKPQNFELRED